MAGTEEPVPAKEKRRTAVLTLAIVLVVALLEGGAFMVVIKFFGGGPRVTYGEEGHLLQAQQPEEDQSATEIPLLKGFKVPNNKTGHTIIYDFDISVVVPQPQQQTVLDRFASREGEIRDRLAQIIRRARPEVLTEDDFGTLRMLMKRALSEIVGDEKMIRRVLIPRCMPIPTSG